MSTMLTLDSLAPDASVGEGGEGSKASGSADEREGRLRPPWRSTTEPSASLVAQKRKKAIELSATSMLCGLFVNAMRQLTQSVNVEASVSVKCRKCSRTIFSTVSKASLTMVGSVSLAAVVKTMKTDFHPLFTLLTRARTICERQRRMSSRISTACDWRMIATKGRRKSF